MLFEVTEFVSLVPAAIGKQETWECTESAPGPRTGLGGSGGGPSGAHAWGALQGTVTVQNRCPREGVGPASSFLERVVRMRSEWRSVQEHSAHAGRRKFFLCVFVFFKS